MEGEPHSSSRGTVQQGSDTPSDQRRWVDHQVVGHRQHERRTVCEVEALLGTGACWLRASSSTAACPS